MQFRQKDHARLLKDRFQRARKALGEEPAKPRGGKTMENESKSCDMGAMLLARGRTHTYGNGTHIIRKYPDGREVIPGPDIPWTPEHESEEWQAKYNRKR